ncbi:suppressor of fused domain protein [Chitinophaga sp. sic0106]|uniref:suppressor of fused domain protein n=1 Tax=Chitinophaga sp. sic0106 TaxID=2854785 RepID=UPI001C45B697|nr:suppressor of fused domain protein [Chitinophaga sp. sic0106]MBV7533800.1 suppressor of fused domain protein [Chitinophaga sp. sic0106]
MYSEPEMLIEETNERGTMYAMVEQDDRTAYFYLYPSEIMGNRFKPRPCWLRNLQPAPEKRDTAAMQNGVAPMLEAKFCKHPEGEAPLEKERISFIWNAEGDGAAILYDNEIIGIIPGWGLYMDQPPAYAAGCVESNDSSITFPLGTPETNIQYRKFVAVADFWRSWFDEENPQWPPIQHAFVDAYTKVFGPHQTYYGIDDNKWPPMAMVSFEKDDIVYFITLGMSIRPMPWVDFLYNENAGAYHRAELGLAMDTKVYTTEQITNVALALAGLADRPWKIMTWLGEGHTLSSGLLPKPYESLILSSALYNGPAIELPQVYGDKVNLYWCVPITFEERNFAHSKENGGYDLLEKMIGEGSNHIVTERNPVV